MRLHLLITDPHCPLIVRTCSHSALSPCSYTPTTAVQNTLIPRQAYCKICKSNLIYVTYLIPALGKYSLQQSFPFMMSYVITRASWIIWFFTLLLQGFAIITSMCGYRSYQFGTANCNRRIWTKFGKQLFIHSMKKIQQEFSANSSTS